MVKFSLKNLRMIWNFRERRLFDKCLFSNRLYCRSSDAMIADHRFQQETTILFEENTFHLNHMMCQKVKAIREEIALLRLSGFHVVPEKMTEGEVMEAVLMHLPSQRRTFYRFLRKKELQSKAESGSTMNNCKNRVSDFLNEHVFLERPWIISSDIQDRIAEFDNNNLIHALQFGQSIVIDLGYQAFMRRGEHTRCINLLHNMYMSNLKTKDPFHLHVCNASENNKMTKKIKLSISDLRKDKPLVTITDKSYMELFPKDRLVYLSPDADDDLEYNHEDVYIIGAVVEKGKKKKLSFSKSTDEGIRMAKLPIEKHLGNVDIKTLTLDEMMRILLKVKDTNNWIKAFEEIPSYRFESICKKQKEEIANPSEGISTNELETCLSADIEPNKKILLLPDGKKNHYSAAEF